MTNKHIPLRKYVGHVSGYGEAMTPSPPAPPDDPFRWEAHKEEFRDLAVVKYRQGVKDGLREGDLDLLGEWVRRFEEGGNLYPLPPRRNFIT